MQELQRQLADAAPAVREELEVISRNGLRLGRLVNTLLDFSRIEAGRMQASYEPADLAQVTAELASVFRSAVDRAGLAFTVDCPPLPEPVYLDQGMWEKVVLNLLSNAVKYTFEGSIRVAVRRRGRPGGRHGGRHRHRRAPTRCPACSSGSTASRTPGRRSNEGSGIGLALVQELIQLHGGTITATSTAGQGTTFTGPAALRARAPARRRPGRGGSRGGGLGHRGSLSPGGHALAARTAPPWMRRTTRGGAGRTSSRSAVPRTRPAQTRRVLHARVLVADDNADMREYLGRLLRAAGYQVSLVTDGQAALDAARARVPDLLLTDVMMPRLDGLALVAELRADPRTAPVPVVLLSARAGEEEAAAGLDAGRRRLPAQAVLGGGAAGPGALEPGDGPVPEPGIPVPAGADRYPPGGVLRHRRRGHHAGGQSCVPGPGRLRLRRPAVRWPHPWVPDTGADPEGRALMEAAFAGYRRHGGGRYTVPARHRDGHTVWLACSSASLPGRVSRTRVFVGTARDVTSERLAAQREATLAGFAAALAATGEISDMLTTAARQLTAALHGSHATIALWSSGGVPGHHQLAAAGTGP